MNYSLIIPIYNEAKTLPSLLSSLDKLNKDIEIIIVDDGSNDDTEKILKNHQRHVLLRNNLNIGKGNSIKKGASLAKNQNLIFIDGDLEIEINEVPKLINEFEKYNPDVLTGTRWPKNEGIYSDINALGNYVINLFFNIFFKSELNDVLCCIKILNKDLFQSLDVQSNRFSIEVETMAKLVKNNVKIREMNINYKRRGARQGKKLKYSDSWAIIGTMLKLRFFTKK